ncbi:transketolase C-terminal domain-containing protein, partial [Desulfonatronospira sp. MSAO_Bac3]|uniref:transketolase-like TK C-terminal-containing protein n=1 Tax=Desulfonatronospira sp. MSAO_Bac3 TaxID=2293857 RepID=UPI000FF0BD3A
EWNSKFAEYQAAYPEQAREFLRCIAGDLPGNLDQTVSEMIKNFDQDKQPLATRKASHKIIDVLTAELPEMLGGSADLTGSNKTMRTGARPVSKKNKDGDYIYYGVREFAMGAIMNGLALHGGFIPFGGTFLVFSDYSRNSLRMGAMMGLRCIHVLTHDSIGVGEDGPTHQPIEHTASLRLIPNMSVWRPCDTVETAVAWHSALKRKNGPTCLVLSRHKLQPMQRSSTQLENIRRGGYILLDCEGTPEAIILASGSEVEPALDAAKELGAKGRRIRMVSMPSINFFMSQDINYQKEVLPREVEIRLAVEAGAGASWHQVLGCRGEAYGIERFGESAPGSILFPYFKMTSTDIAQKLLDMLQQ